MTVSEFIRLLQAHSPDKRVTVQAYEDGYDDRSPEQITVVKIHLNTGIHQWEGRHGVLRHKPDRSSDHASTVDALALRHVSN